jgi:hypothetical protein
VRQVWGCVSTPGSLPRQLLQPQTISKFAQLFSTKYTRNKRTQIRIISSQTRYLPKAALRQHPATAQLRLKRRRSVPNHIVIEGILKADTRNPKQPLTEPKQPHRTLPPYTAFEHAASTADRPGGCCYSSAFALPCTPYTCTRGLAGSCRLVDHASASVPC